MIAHDERGFLIGTPIDVDRELSLLTKISNDISDLKQFVSKMANADASQPAAPIIHAAEPARREIPARLRDELGRFVSSREAQVTNNHYTQALTPSRAVDATANPAAISGGVAPIFDNRVSNAEISAGREQLAPVKNSPIQNAEVNRRAVDSIPSIRISNVDGNLAATEATISPSNRRQVDIDHSGQPVVAAGTQSPSPRRANVIEPSGTRRARDARGRFISGDDNDETPGQRQARLGFINQLSRALFSGVNRVAVDGFEDTDPTVKAYQEIKDTLSPLADAGKSLGAFTVDGLKKVGSILPSITPKASHDAANSQAATTIRTEDRIGRGRQRPSAVSSSRAQNYVSASPERTESRSTTARRIASDNMRLRDARGRFVGETAGARVTPILSPAGGGSVGGQLARLASGQRMAAEPAAASARLPRANERRISGDFTKFFKSQSAYNKASLKLLKEIADKPAGGAQDVGNGFGLSALLPALLGGAGVKALLGKGMSGLVGMLPAGLAALFGVRRAVTPGTMNPAGGMIGRGLGKLGRLARGLPIISGLLGLYNDHAIANDDTLTSEQKKTARAKNFGSTVGSVALGGIGMALGGPIGAVIGATVGDWLGGVGGEMLAEPLANAATFISSGFDDAKNFIEAAWTATTSGITENWKLTQQWFSEKIGGIAETAQKIWTDLSIKFEPIIKFASDLFNGLKEKWDGITSAASQIFDSFAGFIKDKLGIDIKKTVETAVTSAVAVKDKLTEVGGKAWNSAKEYGGKAMETIESAITGNKGNSRLAMKVLMDKGWTKEQAAGISANLAAESGFKINAKGDGGKAFGVAQWHPDRQRTFEKVYGKKLSDATFEEQVGFVDWELKHTEKAAGSAIARAKTATEAAALTEQKYERSALGLRGGAQKERLEAAAGYAKYSNDSIAASAGLGDKAIEHAKSLLGMGEKTILAKTETVSTQTPVATANRLPVNASVNPVIHGFNLPKTKLITPNLSIPSMPNLSPAPAQAFLSEMPTIKEPLANNAGRRSESLSVVMPDYLVGQDVSDRTIAHIATGGIGQGRL